MSKFKPVPLAHLRLTDAFWTRWQRVLVEKTVPAEYEQLESTGRLENLRRAGRRESGGFQGLYFNDSDVHKWLEAACYALLLPGSQAIKPMVDEVVGIIAAAQEEDGYLNSFFQLMHPDLKWRNLGTMHEMYCGGHLIEAAVAHYGATGERRLLDVGTKFADHVMSTFGPGKRKGYCGHEEIELALVRLSAANAEAKYREFARWMVEQRGSRPAIFEAELDDPEAMRLSPWAPGMLRDKGTYNGEYAQDHGPIREHTEVVGHAVRAMYLYAAAAELASDDATLTTPLERVWANLTQKRMYVTGGVGPSAKNEGFTADYDLPNLSAYAETCAAIGLAMWGRRMLELTGESDYADVAERALYNGAISGISLAGDRFFYTNPLESRGQNERVPWFECACCPPNIARMLASVGEYMAGASPDAFYIHIPAGLEARVVLSGVPVAITVESKYPWSGEFRVKVTPERPVTFGLHIRIPEWSDEVTTDVPGWDGEAGYEAGYAVIRRQWSGGDLVSVDLGMEPRFVEADPRVLDDVGRVAVTHGPLVYCLEEPDVRTVAGAVAAPQSFAADLGSDLAVEHRADLLEGVSTISVQGYSVSGDVGDRLYSPLGSLEEAPADAAFIPYYAWGNRGRRAMQVWIRR